MTNPYRQAGYDNAKSGARRSANPHTRYSAAWHEWSAGWYDHWNETRNAGTKHADREGKAQ